MPLTRRRFLATTASLAAVAGLSSFWAYRMPTYNGPVTDHFDGTRFFDPEGVAPKSIGDLLRWQMEGGRTKWPEWAPSPFSDMPPARVTGNALRLSYVGHASWLIQTGGLNILFDPVWSERASPFTFMGPKRVNDPGIAFEKLPAIDIVLVSHGHYDHLDTATLSRLAQRFSPRVITPLGNDLTMQGADPAIKAEAYDWDQRVDLGAGMVATMVPTRHWTARGLLDRNKALWASFVVETPAGKLYIVADSGYGSGAHFRRVRERHGKIRAAILPIGAYEPRWFMSDHHMNPDEAVKAFGDCGADIAFASHHGTFQLTNEAIDAPELALVAARKAAGLTQEQFVLMKPGEAREV